MKKYLLGTMMLVGAMAYGQGNQVIEKVDGSGNATANVGIEVAGEVFNKTEKSLVVEIKSAATPDGRGFAFQMPDLMTQETSNAITGKFTAKVVQDGTPIALTNPIEVELVKDGTGAATAQSKATGAADDTTINYTVTGASQANDLEHNGAVNVSATAGTKVGTYSDNTVSLRVKLEGQA